MESCIYDPNEFVNYAHNAVTTDSPAYSSDRTLKIWDLWQSKQVYGYLLKRVHRTEPQKIACIESNNDINSFMGHCGQIHIMTCGIRRKEYFRQWFLRHSEEVIPLQ